MSDPNPQPVPPPPPAGGPTYGTPASPPSYGTPPSPYGTPAPQAPGAPVYGTPAYGQPGAPVYRAGGYPPGYAPYAAPRTHPLAIAALVTGLLGFALIPVVLGHMALSQVRRTGEGGGWMAVVGLVLGYGTCALYLLLFLVFGGAVLWGGTQA